MSLSSPLGLWLLVLLPVALVLEWLRRAARRRVVPSLVLWEEVARAIGPPPRTRRFDASVAALVVGFSSCALAASGAGLPLPGGTVRDIEIVLDRSAASLARLADGRTRFEAQREEVLSLLRGCSDSDDVRLSVEPGSMRADRRGAARMLLERVEPCADPASAWPEGGTPAGRTRWLVAPALEGEVPGGWLAWAPADGAGNAGFAAAAVGEPDRDGRADLLIRVAGSGAAAPVIASVEADGESLAAVPRAAVPLASAVLTPGPGGAASHLFPSLPLGARSRLVCRLSPGGSLAADDEVAFVPRRSPRAGYLGDVPAPVRAVLEAAGAEGIALPDGSLAASVDILVVSGLPLPALPRGGAPSGVFLVGAALGRTPFSHAPSVEDGEFLPGTDPLLLRDVPRTPLRVRGEAALV
ncbi:MAG: BatA domain-containing protein, partial [Planctomycetes bacterium]|nr:BatA domain-containing protein [Planctomycetota bacterium]